MADLCTGLPSYSQHLHENGVLTPIILVTGTLIALLVVRNNHLSDRPRQNTDEFIYKIDTSKLDKDRLDLRRMSLISQNKRFISRYNWTCAAICLLVLSLIFTGSIDLLPYKDDCSDVYSAYCAWIGDILLFFGLAITISEFIRGRSTLKQNGMIMLPDDLIGKLREELNVRK